MPRETVLNSSCDCQINGEIFLKLSLFYFKDFLHFENHVLIFVVKLDPEVDCQSIH